MDSCKCNRKSLMAEEAEVNTVKFRLLQDFIMRSDLNGYSQYLSAVCRKKKDVLDRINFEDGITLLAVVCRRNLVEFAEVTLKLGADVNLASGVINRTPLHYACEYSSIEMVQLLLKHGANANAMDDEGDRPIHLACRDGSLDKVELLIEHKGDPDVVNVYDQTPLTLACYYFHKEVAFLLLRKFEKLKNSKWAREDLRAALMAGPSFIEVAECLLKAVSDQGCLYAHEKYLHLATRCNNVPIMHLMLKNGYPVDQAGNLHFTPLHEACVSKSVQTEAVILLLRCGADVNALTLTEDSALHYASQAVQLEKVQALLAYGAKVNVIDSSDLSPLGALLTTRCPPEELENYMTLARLLLASGARISDKELYILRHEIPVTLSSMQTEKQISDFIEFLADFRCQPKSLLNICKVRVREELKTPVDNNIHHLGLPKPLEDFLLFKDIIKPLTFPEDPIIMEDSIKVKNCYSQTLQFSESEGSLDVTI